MAANLDRQLAAFRRLISDAHKGGQAKVDAMVALCQRTVYVVPWPGGIEGYRTLVNSQGVAALPMFSDLAELEGAATKYGWREPDGSASHKEVGARAALTHAIKHELAFVVIDIGAEHALELSREEFEPLMSPAARRDSSGPYAAAGRISSSLIRAVRPTPSPAPAITGQLTPPAGTLSAPNVPGSIDPPTGGSSPVSAATPAATGDRAIAILTPLTQEPPDAFFDALTAILRSYPEVEWACIVNADSGSGPEMTLGVRVDAGYRQRVDELSGALRTAAAQEAGGPVEVLLLDGKELAQSARATGLVFYPWRKK